MDRIKSQRQEWMSKSMQEVPEGAGTMDTKPNQSSPGKSIGIYFLHASHLPLFKWSDKSLKFVHLEDFLLQE